jgi:RNA polymerase sigma-70 factor (ECF subfamily)
VAALKDGSESAATRLSLLIRMRNLRDDDAWKEFFESYGPRIFRWCRRAGLQESDASDVTQEVLTRLMRAIQSFDYDSNRGRFRGWLTIVTNNAIRDYVKQQRAEVRESNTELLRHLSNLQSASAIDELAAEIDAESAQEILREAEVRVQLRVAVETWEAYRMTAVESVKPSVVSQKIGMKTSEVYVAKSRVIRMLREEVMRIKEEAMRNVTSPIDQQP